jgi:dihydroxyacetone kinase-like predicted kinase
MSRAAAGMRYGSVTGPGRRGGFAGRDGEEVTVTGADQGDVAAALADMLLSRGGELVTLMEGAGSEPGLARRVADHIGLACPGLEVVCYDGGPVPLLIGVE